MKIHQLAFITCNFERGKKREKMSKASHLPEAPIGWPREIAPPLILTFSGFIPSSLTQAKDCAANASFSSNRSTSSIFHSAFDTYYDEISIQFLPKIAKYLVKDDEMLN